MPARLRNMLRTVGPAGPQLAFTVRIKFLLLLLMSVCSLHTAVCAQKTTHSCKLLINGSSKEFKLTCTPLPGAPSACKLVVYYNNTGPFGKSEEAPTGLVKPPFGVPAQQLGHPQWGSPTFNAIEGPLNRTEVIYKSTTWPILYFYGGGACNVVLEKPTIESVKPGAGAVPYKDPKEGGINHGTALLMFGGGLKATINGGSVRNCWADLGIVVGANSTLTIKDTKFETNSIDKGAVYASWASNLQLQNVAFEKNTGVEGPAMYVVGSHTTAATGCAFDNNAANSAAGAVYIKASSVVFSSTAFTNNKSPKGGALAVAEGSRVKLQQRCKLDGNTARLQKTEGFELNPGDYYKLGVGGAMHMQSSSVDISDSVLSNNQAVIDGGAVAVVAGGLNITNSQLIKNTAYRNGGALAISTTDWSNKSATSTLWLSNVTFEANEAQANGGGMHLERRAHSYIKDSTFKDCKAWNSGAGICTEMASGEGDDKRRDQDLRTALALDNVDFTGSTYNSKLFVGPYFNLTFSDSLRERVNESSVGVVWRRRLCFKGEYVANSQYCDTCPPYQWSTVEGIPGHNATNCSAAPTLAIAPGGAVVVPLSGGWHAVPGGEPTPAEWAPFNNTVRFCRDCEALKAGLNDTRRCPNPDACRHDVYNLTVGHPNSHNAERLSWANYSLQLCNFRDGYEGVLCGVCSRGFGQTAPFKCNRCVGFEHKVDLNTAPAALPGPGAISGLYFVYWLVLTCWLLVAVRFSKLPPDQRASIPAGDIASVTQAAVQMMVNTARKDPSDATVTMTDQQRSAFNNDMPAAAAAAQPADKYSESKSIDILKCILVYVQWMMLIVNLPISWMPWSSAASGSASDAGGSITGFLSWLLGIIFGRSASLDCYLQAQKALQGDKQQQIVANVFLRAVGSAVIVPLVLYLSVLILQLLIFSLQRPLLKALDKLCARSEFVQNHLGGRLASVSAALPDKASRVNSVQGGATLDVQPVNSVTSQASSKGSFMSVAIWGQRVTRSSFAKALRDNAIATALAASMFVYLTICKVAFGMLMCVKGLGGSDRWVMDVRLDCPVTNPSEGWQKGAVAFGSILLFACLAWPIGIAWVLAREAYFGRLLRIPRDDSSPAEQTTDNWAVRYADYNVDYDALSKAANDGGKPFEWKKAWHASYFYPHAVKIGKYAVLCWDSVLDLHRVVLSLVSMCVMLHELHQLILMAIVLSSYLVLVLLVKPWRAAAVWRLQVTALCVLVLSCFGIMGVAVGDAGAYYSVDSQRAYRAVVPVLVILLNLAYLLLIVMLLVRCLIREVPKLDDVKKRMRARWQQIRFRRVFGRTAAAPAGAV